MRKPPWLKIQLPKGENWRNLAGLTSSGGMETVCEEAKCPNLGECWNSGTATFLLLGKDCTRACRFCSVETLKHPAPPDPEEPQKLVQALHALKLKYLVLTTVDRDDLQDQGASHIQACVQAVQLAFPQLPIELLMPDFRGEPGLITLMAGLGLTVAGHNLECVERLSPQVRDPRCGYQQSLQVLRLLKAANPRLATKSGLMLGLGESQDEVVTALEDLRSAGVELVTLGQYLQPTLTKLPVQRYWTPQEFDDLAQIGRKMGFRFVASGPLVRSSYKAMEQFLQETP